MTEDAEYIWKVTWEERPGDSSGWYSFVVTQWRTRAFTNKREAMLFACELEDNQYVRSVKLEKWFGD